MKPLVRWTIGGNVHDLGVECLRLSIKSLKKVYGSLFDYVICFNNLSEKNLQTLAKFDTSLYEQVEDEEMEYKAQGVAWKLYPPRLRYGSHEIFIDNDLIIYERSEIIEKFLENENETIASQGYGYYGKYEKHIKTQIHLNSGFFGIGPNFKFGEHIKYYQSQDTVKDWENYFDEQGLVAACLFNNSFCKIITMEDISHCYENFKFGKIGCHFCGLNKGGTQTFLSYLCQRNKIL